MTSRRRRGADHAISAPACALLAGLLTAAALVGISPSGSAAATPRCFGAAARDPKLGCSSVTRAAVPALGVVEREAACGPVREKLQPVCAFGVRPASAVRHIALVGDSHAMNWRAAVDVVARDRHWRGYSLASPGCLFSAAAENLPGGRRGPCMQWYRSVLGWFGDHPEVSTMFVSQNAAPPIVAAAGRTYEQTLVDGYARTWTRLPRSVKKIIVLRDAPDPSDDTLSCVRRVIVAGKQRPGPACATPRSDAVKVDPAAFAVAHLHSKRYRTVDLTSYFCGRRSCYPVVGGVRVYSDVLGHFTTAFSTTLGPFLLREVRGLIASW